MAGIGAEYHVGTSIEFYANITQAYRPIQFANLQAPPGTDVIDPNLKDARGYNFDIGYRGKLKNIVKFDVSVFYLQYTAGNNSCCRCKSEIPKGNYSWSGSGERNHTGFCV